MMSSICSINFLKSRNIRKVVTLEIIATRVYINIQKADLQVMTTNLADGRIPFDVVKDLGLERPYRLWCKTITAGKPVIILVHGAVVPLIIPNELYDQNNINNEKYCSFYQLDSLLYYDNDFHYNVFTFEYTDMYILEGSVNYNLLTPYGKSLIEAIGFAKERSENQDGTVGPVTVIAHSMGG